MITAIKGPKDVIEILDQVRACKTNEIYDALAEAIYVRPEIIGILIQSGKKIVERQVGVSIDEMAETIDKVINESN